MEFELSLTSKVINGILEPAIENNQPVIPQEQQVVESPMTLKKSNTLVIILAGVFLLGLGLLGGYFLFGNKSQNNSQNMTNPTIKQQTQTSNQTVNWQKVIRKYMQFEYPMTWKVEDNNGIIVLTSSAGINLPFTKENPNPTPSPDMSHIVFEVLDQSFSQSPIKNDSTHLISNWKEITIDGITGHSYKKSGCAPFCPDPVIDLPLEKGTKTLQIQVIKLRDDNNYVDHILSSLRVTN